MPLVGTSPYSPSGRWKSDEPRIMVMSRRRRAGLFMKINDLGPDAPRPTADSFRAILPCANRGRTDVYRPDDNIGTRGCTRCRGATQEAFHRRLSLSALPASHGRGLRCRHRGIEFRARTGSAWLEGHGDKEQSPMPEASSAAPACTATATCHRNIPGSGWGRGTTTCSTC